MKTPPRNTNKPALAQFAIDSEASLIICHADGTLVLDADAALALLKFVEQTGFRSIAGNAAKGARA